MRGEKLRQENIHCLFEFVEKREEKVNLKMVFKGDKNLHVCMLESH